MANSNHRKHPRIKATGRVFIHDQEHIFIAPLNNVSRGGLFVDKLITLAPGSHVKVVIKSAEFSGPLQASGTIVRVETEQRQGSAIQFDWIDIEAFNEVSAH